MSREVGVMMRIKVIGSGGGGGQRNHNRGICSGEEGRKDAGRSTIFISYALPSEVSLSRVIIKSSSLGDIHL